MHKPIVQVILTDPEWLLTPRFLTKMKIQIKKVILFQQVYKREELCNCTVINKSIISQHKLRKMFLKGLHEIDISHATCCYNIYHSVCINSNATEAAILAAHFLSPDEGWDRYILKTRFRPCTHFSWVLPLLCTHLGKKSWTNIGLGDILTSHLPGRLQCILNSRISPRKGTRISSLYQSRYFYKYS